MSRTARNPHPEWRHGSRNTRRRKRRRVPFDGDGDRTLADYLSQVGATPLLERERETELAKTLHESREEFAALVLRLPPQSRSWYQSRHW